MDKKSLVKMTRNGITADVHPAEAANYQAGGWEPVLEAIEPEVPKKTTNSGKRGKTK